MEVILDNDKLFFPSITNESKLKIEDNSFQNILNELQSLEGKEEYTPEEVKKVCKFFESMFVSLLLKQMDKTIPRTGFLDGGLAEEIFRDMLYDKMADKIASQSGIGIADLVYKQLSKLNITK